MRVFLGGNKSSMVALSIMYWECIYSLIVLACIIGYCTCWVVSEWFICIVVLHVYVDFSEVVPCVIMQIPPPLSHGLMTMDIFEVVQCCLSCNVRLL